MWSGETGRSFLRCSFAGQSERQARVGSLRCSAGSLVQRREAKSRGAAPRPGEAAVAHSESRRRGEHPKRPEATREGLIYSLLCLMKAPPPLKALA